MPHMWNRSERIRENVCFGVVFNFVFAFFLSKRYQDGDNQFSLKTT